MRVILPPFLPLQFVMYLKTVASRYLKAYTRRDPASFPPLLCRYSIITASCCIINKWISGFVSLMQYRVFQFQCHPSNRILFQYFIFEHPCTATNPFTYVNGILRQSIITAICQYSTLIGGFWQVIDNHVGVISLLNKFFDIRVHFPLWYSSTRRSLFCAQRGPDVLRGGR